MITKASIEKVIGQADIVEVVGQFLNLKRRGVNYIGLCPFHNEKTPSFNVNPTRGIYKCFGCGRGGDVVSFIREYEKFSFVEAIRWLADYYRIELEETETPDEFKEQLQIEESLRIINEFAADYFHDLLFHDEEGKTIGHGYFEERGFSDETIDHFRLGYCLNSWDNFTQTAISKGFQLDLLEKAGLVKVRNGKPYDNYKDRVIFPIASATGKIIGFGARVLKKTEKAPKYLNTPENELYVKNKVLYGLYQARQSIRKEDECFLVEGYADVVSMHQGGITNVVASSGTSLTDGQLKLIASLSKNLTFLYDGDAAGIKAALRGLDMALEQGFRVRVVLLPAGEDPDSYMQTNGETEFRKYIEAHRQDVIEFHLEIGLRETQNDPIKRNELVNEIAESISKVNKAEDFSLQQYYIRECAAKLDIEEQGLINLVNHYIREKIQKDQKKQWAKDNQEAQQPSMPITEPLIQKDPEKPDPVLAIPAKDAEEEWQLIRLLLAYGPRPYGVDENNEESSVAGYFFSKIDEEILEDPLARQFVQAYHKYWEENGIPPDEQFFFKNGNEQIRHKAVDLFYKKYVPNPGWKDRYQIEVPHGEAIYREEVASSFSYFELKYIQRLIHKNHQQMKSAMEKGLSKEEIQPLLKAHLELKRMEKKLKDVVILKG